MILSSTLVTQLLPVIHEMPQLCCLYVLCGPHAKYEVFTHEWYKMKGVFTQIEPIFGLLEHNIRLCDPDSTSISIIPSTGVVERGLNELEPSFMYSQLLKEILLDIKYTEQAKDVLRQFLRDQYPGNDAQLAIIDMFIRDYHLHSPIYWYTRLSFTYTMLNRALRKMDTGVLMKMGFFLCDVHRQMEQLYHDKMAGRRPMTVYRGQVMSDAEFQSLIKSKGGLLSFNNFLSTSTTKNVSLMFCSMPPQGVYTTTVLFEIKVDPKLQSTPFASLRNVSFYRAEDEILFSMHAMFRIGAIENPSKGFWHVQLTQTDQSDEEMNIFREHLRDETRGKTGWHRLGQLMIRMQKLDQAEDIYQILLREALPDDHEELALIYNQLGCIQTDRGNNQQALELHQKALEIRARSVPSDHLLLGPHYSNIGLAYDSLGDCHNALFYYQKSLEIMTKSLSDRHSSLAIIYGNIGAIHFSTGNSASAISFYKKSLDIMTESLPDRHPSLATICCNIAAVQKNMGNYPEAIEYYRKALNMQEKSLTQDHPSLAITYSNIAGLYDTMKDHVNALSFYQKALGIKQQCYPADHPELASIYSNIGLVYMHMRDFAAALSFFEQVLEVREKTLPEFHPSLATIYNNMGGLRYHLKEYAAALTFHKKALDVQRKSLTPDHPSMATTYCNMGGAYETLGDNTSALSCYEQALEIGRRSLPEDHPHIKAFQEHIAAHHSAQDDRPWYWPTHAINTARGLTSCALSFLF